MTWLITAGAAIAVAGVAFVNSGFFNEQIEKASLSYLSGIQLKALDGSGGMVKSSDLWQKRGAVIMVVRRPGCSLCREVSLKDDLWLIGLTPMAENLSSCGAFIISPNYFSLYL